MSSAPAGVLTSSLIKERRSSDTYFPQSTVLIGGGGYGTIENTLPSSTTSGTVSKQQKHVVFVMVQGLVIFVVVMDGYLEWGWGKMVTVNLVSTIMENVQLVEEEALGSNNIIDWRDSSCPGCTSAASQASQSACAGPR